MTVEALARALACGETTSARFTREILERIARENGRLNAYIEVFAEEALAEADASDRRRAAGAPLSPLDGVPIAVKDNIVMQGHVCSCASRMLSGFVSPYDATVIRRIRAAGMPILGRLNMDEFAMGVSTETSFYGPTRNPIDPSRVPGGSSGGCAAAVAADLAPIALGSDTGGSLRQPASFCGVVGVKPAYGAVSRYGLVAFASSLDQIGPVAQTARDASLLLELLCGPDELDRTSDPSLVYQPVDVSPAACTLGVVENCFTDGLDTRVRAAVECAAQRFARMGALVRAVRLPLLASALPAYYVLSSAEASSNLARYDGVRYGHRAATYADLDELYRKSRQEGFGAEVQRRILLGVHALSEGYQDAYYLRACGVRDALCAEVAEVLNGCDALLMPVSPTPAWRFGERSDPIERYLGDLYTVAANLTGLPAVSIPCGLTPDGLPIGLGMMADRHGLGKLLSLCDAFDAAADKGGESA